MDMFIPSYGSGYGAWANVMAQWENFGVFTILLPFILVFAVVFAILERIALFKDNRGVNILIAIVIGFFTISNPYVSYFFRYIFGNLAWGIAIMIAVVILLGLTLKPEETTWKWIFGVLAAVLFLSMMSKPMADGKSGLQFLFGDSLWYWIQANSAMVVIGLFVAFAVMAIVMTGKKPDSSPKFQLAGK